jgi:Transposase DNA-binding/Transposase Tn5 dimerisation domain
MSHLVGSWARETFGSARLPDARLARRALEIVAAVARRPGGTITRVFSRASQREAAFRFVENPRVDCDALTDSMGRAAALRCHEQARVWVAVDQADLTFVDRKQIRGLGPVNNRNSESLSGLQVMSSLVLDDRGVPLGLLDQQWWLRSEEASPRPGKDRRPPEARESWKWVESMRANAARIRDVAPDVTPWFIMDRGADFWGVFEEAKRLGTLLTVRSTQDRILLRDGRRRHLRATLSRQPILGSVEIAIPGGHGRTARSAKFELRVVSSVVPVRARLGIHVALHAVRLREISRVPVDEERIEWTLLTNFEVKTADDAMLVVRGYGMRWRIEEFHKTWKSGACDVESSQLRSFEAIRRWATILAAVAARIERLKHLSRTTPDVAALEEFSPEELEAAILISETKKFAIGAPMTLRDAVRLVASVGGYTNRNGDGPPGSITIRRGLDVVVPAAAVLRASRGRSG